LEGLINLVKLFCSLDVALRDKLKANEVIGKIQNRISKNNEKLREFLDHVATTITSTPSTTTKNSTTTTSTLLTCGCENQLEEISNELVKNSK
jgi:hypothetical protein